MRKSRMKNPVYSVGIVFLILIAVVCPAQAFTAKTLDITVQDNNDAIITFTYELSWFENAAVFSRIADPGTELAKALKNQFNRNVDIVSVSGNQAQIRIPEFAIVKEKEGIISTVTPSLSFKNAEKTLKKYWFAPLISPDFSPEVTRVSFPDGYYVEYYNLDTIPSIRHTPVMPAEQ